MKKKIKQNIIQQDKVKTNTMEQDKADIKKRNPQKIQETDIDSRGIKHSN